MHEEPYKCHSFYLDIQMLHIRLKTTIKNYTKMWIGYKDIHQNSIIYKRGWFFKWKYVGKSVQGQSR